jgi:hypothetical protein
MFGGSRSGPAIRELAALTLGFVAGGCQSGYPIAPTACDQWCDATGQVQCSYFDPAACVADCEQQGLTSKPECAATFAAALECYRSNPPTARGCVGPGAYGVTATLPCQTEYASLRACVDTPD